MDSKKRLLNAYYSTIDRSRFKVETRGFVPELLDAEATHGAFTYGEFKNGIFKYCFSGAAPALFDWCLESHLRAELNICCYLNPQENSIFAFNLDSYEKLDAVDNTPEIRSFAEIVSDILVKLCLRPMIIRSGHGYHFWCRLAEPVANSKLQSFMDAVVAVATFELIARRIEIGKLQCICYPRVNTRDVSIRLFGSRHTVTGRFSGIVKNAGENETILDEEQSWQFFEQCLNQPHITREQFAHALDCVCEIASHIK